MKIVFFSGSDFTLPLLEFIQTKHQVLLVTKAPVLLRGKLIKNSLYTFAESKDIPVLTPSSLKKLTQEEIIHYFGEYDIGIVASYGKIIPQTIIDIFAYGMINWHPSLLPLYRGPTPVQSSIMNGDRESGLTWIQMDAGIDSGKIIKQIPFTVNPDETTLTILAKAIQLGIESIDSVIIHIHSHLPLTTQDETKATFTKILTPQDGEIEPHRMNAQSVYNHFRAYLSFPKTYFLDPILGRVRILACSNTQSVVGTDTTTQGVFVQHSKKTYLRCKDSYLEVQCILLENGKKIDFRGVVFS